jgi:hypothetical protein
VLLLSMCDTYNHTFLLKPKESAFKKLFLGAIFIKEILLSFDAEECRHLAALTSHTIFSTLIFHRCQTSQVSREKSGLLFP